MPRPIAPTARSLVRRTAVAVAALALAVTSVTACSAAAPAPASDSTSTRDVYLVSIEDGSAIVESTPLRWDADALGSPVETDETWSHPFTAPAGATTVVTFLSPRGSEHDPKAWNASGWLAITAGAVQSPNLKPFANTEAGTGTPAGAAAVATTGGDYSLGIAFLDDSARVVEADFVAITVTASADPSAATWTWKHPSR